MGCGCGRSNIASINKSRAIKPQSNTTPKADSKIITYSNITLDGLYIHDINGITDKENSGMSAESKKTGGIHFGSLDGKAKFDNLIIKNCKIKYK